MNLDNLGSFLAIAKTDSLLSASEESGKSRATLRRRLAQFEQTTKVQVVRRSRDGIELTDAGRALFSQCSSIVHELENLISSAKSLASAPAGIVRVAVPVGLPWPSFATLAERLRQDYPEVQVELTTAREVCASLLEGDDIAVHVGDSPPHGPWLAIDLPSLTQRLVASHAYLEEHSVPRALEDLADHALLSWKAPGVDPEEWPGGDATALSIVPTMISDNAGLILAAVRNGAGIGFVPVAGSLTEDPAQVTTLFEGLVERKIKICLLVPRAIAEMPRVRAVVGLLRGQDES